MEPLQKRSRASERSETSIIRALFSSCVVDAWPSFTSYADGVVAKAQARLDMKAKCSFKETLPKKLELRHALDYVSVSFLLAEKRCVCSVYPDAKPPFFERWVWLDREDLRNEDRLRILLVELQQRGFECVVEECAFGALVMHIGVRLLDAPLNGGPLFAQPGHVSKSSISTSCSLEESDFEALKYDCAKRMYDSIGMYEASYTNLMRSRSPKDRERSVVVYLIHRFGFSIGERPDEELNLFSLSCLHLQLAPPDSILIHAPREDSIWIEKEIVPISVVYAFLEDRLNTARPEMPVFSLTTPEDVKEYLLEFVDGASCEAMHICTTSAKLQELLYLADQEEEEQNDVEYFWDAITKVPILRASRREDGVAVDLARMRYVDPRITVAWCVTNRLKIEDILPPMLCRACSWAKGTPSSFRFAEDLRAREPEHDDDD